MALPSVVVPKILMPSDFEGFTLSHAIASHGNIRLLLCTVIQTRKVHSFFKIVEGENEMRFNDITKATDEYNSMVS